jgi:hypothetical protein
MKKVPAGGAGTQVEKEIKVSSIYDNHHPRSTVDHALTYAARGWHVFPGLIRGRQKMSYVSADRSNGRQWGNTTDPTLIREYYERIPEALIGIACGEDSGIWIVETDTKEGGHAANGADALAALEAQHGALPPTLQAKSPSGSIHYYFNWPEGVDIRNSAGAIAPGIDVRANGGMVIAPPSMRADGAYEWINDLPVADAPQWLVELAVKAKASKTSAADPVMLETIEPPLNPTNYAEQVLNAQYVRVAAAPAGTRNPVLNNAAYQAGRYVGAGELPEQLAIDTLLKACAVNGLIEDDGERSCLATIGSGLKGGKANPAKTSADMFGSIAPQGMPSVANVQAMPVPPKPAATIGGVPMMDGQITVAELGTPILQRYLDMAGTTAAPFETQVPPDHPLAESLGFALGAIMSKRRLESAEFDVLAVLAGVHPPAFDIVREKLGLQSSGNLSAAVARFMGKVNYEIKTKGGFVIGGRELKPLSALPANLHHLLRIVGCEVRRNEWLERDEIRGGHEWPNWTYIDDGVVAQLLTEARNNEFAPSDNFMWQTLTTFARGNRVDPMCDKLKELENAWDGTPRLDTWLSNTVGAKADDYHRIVGRRIIGGMVRRIREPGCKVDEMAILISDEGFSKSTLCKKLAPTPDGFTDDVKLGEESKELVLLLAGVAVAEIAEMHKRDPKALTAIKAMISRQTDRGRTAYARSVSHRPRRNIFIGTSNYDTPLTDVTGNRRSLPVRCKRIDEKWFDANREQLIGEACALQTKGDTFDIPPETWAITFEHQEAARSRSPVEDLLESWFTQEDLLHPAMAQPSEFISKPTLNALLSKNFRRDIPTETLDPIMKRLGFVEDRQNIDRKAFRMWRRGEWRTNGEGMTQHQEWPEGNHSTRYLPSKRPVPPPPV